MEKTKVIIIYAGGKYWGGVEDYLLHLFELYPKRELELLFVSLGDWELTKKIESIGGSVLLLSQNRMRLETVAEIARFAEKKKASLIVSQGLVGNFYARMSARRAKLPVLITVHSDYQTDYAGSVKKLLFFLSARLTRKSSDKYIAVSNYLKEVLMQRGITEGQIKVIYNGIKPIQAKRKKVGTELTVGSIGRLHPVKGFDALIDAAKLLPGVNFKIWGEGPERNKLQVQISKLKLENRFKLMGFEKSLDDIFEEIDIYIQPSRSEGFGLTVAEAMLAQKPVIVSPVGSLTEIVRDGETGLVAPSSAPQDLVKTIKKFLDNPQLSRDLAKKGRETVAEKFSQKQWIEGTVSVFLEATK